MRNPDPSPEYLAAFHEAAYRLAGKRPQVGEDEPAWNVDLFEVERQARAACPIAPGDELNWKPNIDGGIEAEGYEIYGPIPDKGWSLMHEGTRLDYYWSCPAAQRAAERHRKDAPAATSARI